MVVKNCTQCDRTYHARLNQRFCTTRCKADFNNAKARERLSFATEIEKKLRRNRLILHDLFTKSEIENLSTEILGAKGYSLQFLTHLVKDKEGKHHRAVFDYCLRESEGKFSIEKL